jgi:RNA polymerase sigma factor (TIGR02999 family)
MHPANVFMINAGSHEITHLLSGLNRGDQGALEQLMPLVYDELRRMARNYMRRQPSGHTLQTTELIHEAYLKIAGRDGQNFQNRAHFFAVAATAMRHILVDYAKSKQRNKRGGGQYRVTLADADAVSYGRSEEILALDDALRTLEKIDERRSRVVELKFFGGLTVDEITEVLKVSPETVKRDWQFAKVWLLRELAKAG